MHKALPWMIVMITSAALGQGVTYYNQGLLRQASALADRNYLGIYGSNITGWGTPPPWLVITNAITNYSPGTNITFMLTSPLNYEISSSGGGGTNVYITNTFTTNVYVTNTFTTNNYYTNLVDQTNIYATNLLGFSDGTNILFTTNSGTLYVNCTIDTNNFADTNYVNVATNTVWTNTTNYVNSFQSTLNVWFSSDGKTNYAGFGAKGGGTGTQFNTAVGYGADSESHAGGEASSFGHNANGGNFGAAFGGGALGYDFGAGFGNLALGGNRGVAVGYDSDGVGGTGFGVSVGWHTRGYSAGVAVGADSSGQISGVAVGATSIAYSNGVAIGNQAIGRNVGNIAIGSTDGIFPRAIVPDGTQWTNTIELGLGTAVLAGGFNLWGKPIVTSNACFVLTQLQFIPTNTIPTSEDGITNWIFCCVSNYGPVLLATNRVDSGYQKILMNAPTAL